jgi:hypothetical protein
MDDGQKGGVNGLAASPWTFVALRLAGSLNIPRLSKRQPETLLQRRSVEWLVKIRNCAPLRYPVTSPAAGKCRNEDNGDFYAGSYEIFLELRPAHSAHLYVGYQTLCPIDKLRVQECFTRSKGLDVISERLHQRACCHADAIIVIYNGYQWNQSQDNPPLARTPPCCCVWQRFAPQHNRDFAAATSGMKGLIIVSISRLALSMI